MSSTTSSSQTKSSPTKSSTSTAPTSLPHIQHLITIKLNRDNYLLWKAQIVPYLRGQHLYGFIDGTNPAPPSSVTASTSDTTAVLPNPEFSNWHTQDQMILSALISSLSETVLAHVIKCTTSRAVWLCLERMFTSQSRARSMQLHHQLSTLKKVTAIQQRRGDVTLDELYGDFLSHELRLAQHQPSVDLSLASANFTNRSSSNRGGRGGRSPHPPTSSNSGRSFNSNQHRQYRGRGRGRGPSNNTSRPTCQVCHKLGHTALTCYHSDSGATHHLTSDLANLNVRADEYHGPDQIRVGSGSGKTLLAGRDLDSGKTLLCGPSKDGLYPFPLLPSKDPSTPTALFGERTSIHQWHSRLGHPAFRVPKLQKISTPHQKLPKLQKIPAASLSTETPETSNPSPEKSTSPENSSTTANPPPPPPLHPMKTRSQHQISKPKTYTDGTIRYPIPKALLAETTSDPDLTEPTCYTSASKSPHWCRAMNLEFDALLKNQTWTLVPSSSSHNLIGCKWVFRIKRHADGSIERFKAQLVAKGFHQQAGIDYGETYSPVIKPTMVRAILSIAISAGWSIRQIDIQNAFLHGQLSEDVFMTQPPGYQHPSYPTHVCKLNKAIYGLKQAPRAWFSRLSSRLLQLGFHGSLSDTSLFIYKSKSFTMFILIYVDDIIITCSNPAEIDELLILLQSDFAVKDLGKLN
uniref:Reverse transcriptase Ty1/copia-type domain-containing protein n=1 Tax=Fagus sylvatica TaxID=28930 RepID=A0A2N9GP72_FAGSY